MRRSLLTAKSGPPPFAMGTVADFNVTSPTGTFGTAGSVLFVTSQTGQTVTAPRTGTLTSCTFVHGAATTGTIYLLTATSAGGSSVVITGVSSALVSSNPGANVPEVFAVSVPVNIGDWLGFYLPTSSTGVVGNATGTQTIRYKAATVGSVPTPGAVITSTLTQGSYMSFVQATGI